MLKDEIEKKNYLENDFKKQSKLTSQTRKNLK
jgi:hypothetical protein